MSHNKSYQQQTPEKLPPVYSNRSSHKQYTQPSNNNKITSHNKSFLSSQSKPTQNLSRSVASSTYRSQVETQNPMIRSFKESNNPFDQGFTRSDKIRYQGSPESRAHTRLHEFSTISSQNHSYGYPRYNQSQRVKGVENLRLTFQKNRLMQQIIDEEDLMITNPLLMTNIESLWKMNLLQDKNFKKNSLPKNQNIAYVYNDYHSRSTNPGYARNDMGGAFFTR